MELVDKIDAQEVLSHLHQLGYQNISPHQLKEFVQDLKKLIVHDQLSSSSGSLTSLSSSSSAETEYYSSNETVSTQSEPLGNLCQNQMSYPVRTHNCDMTGNSDQSSLSVSTTSSVPSTGKTLRRSTLSLSSLPGKHIQKENLPAKKRWSKATSEENILEAVKPRSSFIRPWQLHGAQPGPSKPAPRDPVKLYHHYQTLWAKHKCPGEDSRADLRWTIREKMLGQDPQLFTRQVSAKNTRMRM